MTHHCNDVYLQVSVTELLLKLFKGNITICLRIDPGCVFEVIDVTFDACLLYQSPSFFDAHIRDVRIVQESILCALGGFVLFDLAILTIFERSLWAVICTMALFVAHSASTGESTLDLGVGAICSVMSEE